MDPLGVAEAALALGLYPGGILLLAVGWSSARLAGAPRWAPTVRDITMLAVLDVAVASAPLPASPAAALPPGAGAAPDLLIVALALAAAVAIAAPTGWSRWRLVAVISAVVAGAAVAVGAASISMPVIAGTPGAAMTAARAATAAALLVAGASAVSGTQLTDTGSAVLRAGFGLVALSLASPRVAAGWRSALAAGAIVVATLLYATVSQRWSWLLGVGRSRAGGFAAALCVAAITAVTLAGHG
ncbi:MAG: hypothetical protein JOY80_01690 [Candidatus Dormibacteraeota bacterium]|nr:hypothetical protein [Candidatus Dormibacteraeota bacterium]